MKTLVIGLGNPILGDDGVGWRVAEEVGKRLPSRPSPLAPLPKMGEGGMPSPLAPLPKGEGSMPSPQAPLPRGEGDTPSPLAPLPKMGEGDAPSQSSTLPKMGEEGTPSPLHSSPVNGRVDEGEDEIQVDTASLGGLSLMERLAGYDRVILVDAIFTGQKPVGTVSRFTLAELPDLTAGHSASAHDTSLRNALTVGRKMEIPLPKDEAVFIVAIEAERVYDFTEELSPAVAAAVPLAVGSVFELIAQTN